MIRDRHNEVRELSKAPVAAGQGLGPRRRRTASVGGIRQYAHSGDAEK